MDPASDTKLEELEAQLQELYARAVAGDRIAAAELTELIWATYGSRRSLVNAFKAKGWIRDDAEAKEEVLQLVGLLAAKFIASVIAGESNYDSAEGPLGAYLQLMLSRKLINEAEKLQRHTDVRHAGVLPDENVGDGPFPWNLQETVEDQVIDRMELIEMLKPFRDSLQAEERTCFDLIAQDVRETEPYADALGITHLPIEEQRDQVNKIKERLKKRAKRLR